MKIIESGNIVCCELYRSEKSIIRVPSLSRPVPWTSPSTILLELPVKSVNCQLMRRFWWAARACLAPNTLASREAGPYQRTAVTMYIYTFDLICKNYSLHAILVKEKIVSFSTENHVVYSKCGSFVYIQGVPQLATETFMTYSWLKDVTSCRLLDSSLSRTI